MSQSDAGHLAGDPAERSGRCVRSLAQLKTNRQPEGEPGDGRPRRPRRSADRCVYYQIPNCSLTGWRQYAESLGRRWARISTKLRKLTQPAETTRDLPRDAGVEATSSSQTRRDALSQAAGDALWPALFSFQNSLKALGGYLSSRWMINPATDDGAVCRSGGGNNRACPRCPQRRPDDAFEGCRPMAVQYPDQPRLPGGSACRLGALGYDALKIKEGAGQTVGLPRPDRAANWIMLKMLGVAVRRLLPAWSNLVCATCSP